MKNRYLALKLSALMVFIYAVQLIAPEITSVLGFRAAEFPSGFWTIITSFFIHSTQNYMHIVNNLFFLAIFGTVLEHYIGSKNFLIFFFSAGVFANLSAFFFYYDSLILGVSGAVSGIIALLAVLKPKKIGLFWGAPLPMWLVAFMWLLTNFIAIGADSGVAYEAHLFGLGFGLFLGSIYRLSSRAEKVRYKDEFEISEKDLRRWEDKYMN